MFRGPSLIVSTMQEETTPIFKRLWYDWTQQQPGIEPTNPLGQCWVPPIIAFYDQQGLLKTYSLPGGSGAPTPDPHGVGTFRMGLFFRYLPPSIWVCFETPYSHIPERIFKAAPPPGEIVHPPVPHEVSKGAFKPPEGHMELLTFTW